MLIYLERKQAAFAEFSRVLRPWGRLSIFEPINSFAVADQDCGLFGFDVAAVADAEQDPMLNFDERDLLRWARAAGFTALELDYRAEVEVPEPLPTTDWDVLKKIAPNPLAPTFEEALAQTLTDGERDRFESHVRAVLAAACPPARRSPRHTCAPHDPDGCGVFVGNRRTGTPVPDPPRQASIVTCRRQRGRATKLFEPEPPTCLAR